MKRLLSILLCALMFVSVLCTGFVSASADTLGLPPVAEGCNRYFFLVPMEWYLYSDAVGIYWWDGTNPCTEWPGYKAYTADVPNVCYYDVPKDVSVIIWNNYIDGGTDKTQDIYYASKQTANICTEYYLPGESLLYPDGLESFDGMIFAGDPDLDYTSSFYGRETLHGEWYFYYGNAECGVNKEKVSGDYTISINYMKSIFPNNNYAYYMDIAPCFYPEYYFEGYIDRVKPWGSYDMLYAHFEDNFREPEYVVFEGCVGPSAYAYSEEQFGEYLVIHHETDRIYDISHYVYVPDEKKVYTLREAWESDTLDITPAFESGRVGRHRGDANLDGDFDIKDATHIQKYLADLDDIKSNRFMNYDNKGMVTIRDATAIQKAIAGMDE